MTTPSDDREARVLLDTPALLVRRVPHPSPVCAVTFGHYEAHPAAVRTGFGELVLNHHGIDAIHVISRANDWFQNSDMVSACAAIRAALAGKPAVTYGSSMGGYAAVRFAGAIGAARALALSPQYSIDRRVVPFERRWREESERVRFLPWKEVAPPPPAIILFDPDLLDLRHVALWAAERPVTAVRLPRTGHPATTILAELGLLLPALLDVLADRFDGPALVRAFRARRRRSAEYLAILSDAQPARRAAWKIDLMRAAVRAAPERPHLLSRLAMLLYRAGRNEESDAAHRRARALDGADALLAFRYSMFLQRVGRFDDALIEARAAAACQPDSAPLARHARRLRRLAGPPGPVRLALRLANGVVRGLDRASWGRRPGPFGRLSQP